VNEAVVALLVAVPIWLLGALAVVDVVRRRDLGIVRKLAWAALLVLFTPVTLVYLLARPVGDVGEVGSARLGPDDRRLAFTEAVESGDLRSAAALWSVAQNPRKTG
jgi:hypothetical protein